jgi:hypothetical protein
MSGERIKKDTYDRGIMPAETKARIEREQDDYKHTPDTEKELDTAKGYTMNNEGLLNNFAVEPEMYYEEPGDLRRKEQREEAERAEELAEVNETQEDGRLTADHDDRGKGPGVF